MPKKPQPDELCPTCGQPITYEPHPDKPGIERAFCDCNPIGPVRERPAAQPAAAAETKESNL